MILKDFVHINAAPEKVWAFVEDPERMKEWNPKVRRLSPISWGARGVGYRYRIVYAMSKKESEFFAEITEYRPPEKLVIHLSEGNLPRGCAIAECYDLSRTTEGTLLEQRIEISNSGINIFLRLLIGFIMRFGKPTGKKYLETLKGLVEASS